jgi:hypothetical protein
MIGNKKGLSDIVITLLIVVLSLVAIGGVWFVVRNVLNTGNQQTDVGAKCLAIAVDATRVTCETPSQIANHNCSVALSKTGSEAVSGVKLVFKNAITGTQSSAAIDVAGDVAVAVGKTTALAAETNTLVVKTSALDTVEVIPYFTDASGNIQLCQQKTSFKFVAVAQ